MKIDYLSCTKMLYFAEKLLRDGYYELPDITDAFAKQFDMTANEAKEICEQFEYEKLLVWEDKPVEIEDKYGNLAHEMSYDALLVDQEAVKKQVAYLKEHYVLRQTPFIPREAVFSIAKQIEKLFSKDEWLRAVVAFAQFDNVALFLNEGSYTLTDLLFRHAYARKRAKPLSVVLTEFLNPIYYDINGKETANKLFEYINSVLTASASKDDYQEWLKEAAKYTAAKKSGEAMQTRMIAGVKNKANLDGFSEDNLRKIKKFVELVYNQIELADCGKLQCIVKIPLSTLIRAEFDKEEAKIMVNAVNRIVGEKLIVILRDEIYEIDKLRRKGTQSSQSPNISNAEFGVAAGEFNRDSEQYRAEILNEWLETEGKKLGLQLDDFIYKFVLKLENNALLKINILRLQFDAFTPLHSVSEMVSPKPAADEVLMQDNPKPYTEARNGQGYFKFYKQATPIKIGGLNSRHYRLLDILCSPFGAHRTIASVFESIRLPKDKNDTTLNDSNTRAQRMLQIIENTKKELQKERYEKLRGKLKYQFDDRKQNMWLEVEG